MNAQKKSTYRADLKTICGEHPVFVDSFNGQHPMHNGPVPSASENDVTRIEMAPIRS